MNKTLHIILFGPGNVGTAFLHQLFSQRVAIKKTYGIDILVNGVFSSKGGVFSRKGLTKKELDIRNNKHIKMFNSFQSDIAKLSEHIVMVDTTASDTLSPILLEGLKKEHSVVMSNKKNLAGKQTIYNAFTNYRHRVLFETTVGAGLPIISTIQDLLETGDKIIEITGCFSGTLGFIFTLLQKGESFSSAVRKAKKLGYTEPDPRDDLAGTDVARKVLILSRFIGKKISLENIPTESLYPEVLQKYSVNEFLEKISFVDKDVASRVRIAQQKGNVLKYIARINCNTQSVGIQEVPAKSDIGSLEGPDNIIVLKTKRYDKNPLVVKGPGAGLEVTAAGVFSDILKIIRTMYEKT